jgi:peptidoglycan/xylan/chitin deacetylase (PgdA/CDA1 family)
MDSGQLAGPPQEAWLIRALYGTQAYRVARRLTRQRIVMAMYHGFTAADVHEGIENHEGKHVHVDQFRAHLAYLKQHHTVVPLGDVVQAMTAGTPLPDRTAVITIDDGYRSIYTVAYPALREFGLPASAFLTTAFVDDREYLWTDRVEYAVNRAEAEEMEVPIGDTRLRLDLRAIDAKRAAERHLRGLLKSMPQASRFGALEAIERAAGRSLLDAAGGSALYDPLTWEQTAEMARSGLVSIGSHTHTHVILSRCDPPRASEELRESKRIIEGRLAMPCRLFCYPNGRAGDFSTVTGALVRAEGYACALPTVYGSNGRGGNVYELKRYNFGKPMIRGELEVRLSGLFDAGSRLARLKTAGARLA